MTVTHWLVGRRIVEQEQGGIAVLLERLAADLTSRFGRGFSVDDRETMRAFFAAYPSGCDVRDGVSDIPGHATSSSIPACTASSPAAAWPLTGHAASEARRQHLLPVRVLSRGLRGTFLAALRREYRQGRRELVGAGADLIDQRAFHRLQRDVYRQDWVVYAKRP